MWFRFTDMLLNPFRSLQRLDLEEDSMRWVFDDGIKGMKLTELNLANNHNITNKGIENMPLTKLSLSNNVLITNEGIKDLPLVDLDLSHVTLITDSGIQALPFLTNLGLQRNGAITDKGIQGKKLTGLNLHGNGNISDEGIKGLPLKTLNLCHNEQITNDAIRNMPITHLTVNGKNLITEDGIKDLPLEVFSFMEATDRILAGPHSHVLISFVQSIFRPSFLETKGLKETQRFVWKKIPSEPMEHSDGSDCMNIMEEDKK